MVIESISCVHRKPQISTLLAYENVNKYAMWYACLVLTDRNGSFFLHAIKKSKCNKLTENGEKNGAGFRLIKHQSGNKSWKWYGRGKNAIRDSIKHWILRIDFLDEEKNQMAISKTWINTYLYFPFTILCQWLFFLCWFQAPFVLSGIHFEFECYSLGLVRSTWRPLRERFSFLHSFVPCCLVARSVGCCYCCCCCYFCSEFFSLKQKIGIFRMYSFLCVNHSRYIQCSVLYELHANV